MSRRRRFLPLSLCLYALALPGAIPAAAVDVEAPMVDVPPETAPAPEAKIDLDAVVGQRMVVNDATAQSQVRIDELSSQADTAIAIYRSTNQRIDALRTYNHQLEQLITSQDGEVAGLRREIDDVELVAREITPLMLGMIQALENFVELDVPFLAEERAVRIAGLREVMGQSNVTDAERYRRIIEAYQIENEYGRTIEVYRGELDLGETVSLVDFLRVGRISLMYQTLDLSETGVWDHRNQEWKDAAESRSAIRKGIRIARKQTAPDLMRIPVPTAEAAK
jgi:hypothetical protein